MGQTRNVLVYRLLCEDTVDEKIMSTLESKQAIFEHLLINQLQQRRVRKSMIVLLEISSKKK